MELPQESSWFSWFLGGEAAAPAAAPPADDAAVAAIDTEKAHSATINADAIYLEDTKGPLPSSTLPRETLEAEHVRRQMSRKKILQRQKTGPCDGGEESIEEPSLPTIPMAPAMSVRALLPCRCVQAQLSHGPA